MGFAKSKLLVLAFLVTSSIVSTTPFISNVEADQGNVSVYILQLKGVGTTWFDNPSRAREGAVEASTLVGKFMKLTNMTALLIVPILLALGV